MAGAIRFDLSKAVNFIDESEIANLSPYIGAAHMMLHEGSGPGGDYLGWVDLPFKYDKREFAELKEAAECIKDNSDILIVIGIGGSYLGARAAIEMLAHPFLNHLPREKRKGASILYSGNNLSGRYLSGLFDILEGHDIMVNVISKSGTTTEPAVAFRFLKEYMEKRYGRDEARRRIIATTDRSKGALRRLVQEEGYRSFVIPDDIGGRYSVLTAVGLLPIGAAGIDIDEIMAGAGDACRLYQKPDIEENDCYRYAAARNCLYRKGKSIEIMVNYEPSLHYFCEWWKQLFGESEGKENKGIFPASVDFTTDLHSMGQYIQEGRRDIFESVLNIEERPNGMEIPSSEHDLDGLNYLSGKSVDHVNKMAFEGTLIAHTDGRVPNLIIDIPDISGHSFGGLVYFFEKACGMSGYLMGVNPFDQPGVEAYKKNMFALLGKPGYERE
jgi:glucose-6-phosphate isomerase